MKRIQLTVEFETEEEIRDFLAWRVQQSNADRRNRAISDFEKTEIGQMDMPSRLRTVFRFSGVTTISEAKRMTDIEWLKVQCCGKRALAELRDWLHESDA